MTSYWIVQILDHKTKEVVKEFKPQVTQHVADKLDRGVNINLDHERFYTRVIEEKNGERLTS